MALPFIRIYIGDLKKDTDLLSPAAFGGYMRLILFAMHEAPTRGVVSFTLPQLCRVFGAANLEEARIILNEIVDPQFNIVDYAMEDTGKHFIRNRRMVRETKISHARSEAGKKGAEVSNGKTKHIAESLPKQNGGNEQHVVFASANSEANESAKNQQNCNNNNSNNSNNLFEEKGVEGEKETMTQGSQIHTGANVLIVPELKAIWMKHRKAYQFDVFKDSQPLRLIGEAISKGENVSAYEFTGIDQIKTTFEAIVVWSLTHNLYKNFQLSQFEKYFQTICEAFRNSKNGDALGTTIGSNLGPKVPVSTVTNNMKIAAQAAELIKRKYGQTA
jgi:uncharacterized protein YdaU (DUF1376 family)